MITRKKKVNFLETNRALNNGQHGLRHGRSCLSQLLLHYDTILGYIQDGRNTDIICLKFVKAFNKVDHGILLPKLRVLGIEGPLVKWIHNLLMGRTQPVSVQGELSDQSLVRSGIPQGSIIRPLLSIIHIGDIDTDLEHSATSSFANDTRIKR